MDNDKIIYDTQRFKQLLDKLPYLSEAEKAIACSLYAHGDDSIHLDMVKFYADQYYEHEKIINEYQQKVDAARKEFFTTVKSILSEKSPS